MNIRTEIRPGRTIHLSIHNNPASDVTAFLIHGLGGRGDQWREQIPVLAKQYTLIIPDLLGHGNSDKPCPAESNPYTFDEYHQDLEALFRQYASQKNIVFGHSYGGSLGLSLTRDHQDKIFGLVLIAPVPCIPNTPVPFIYRLPVFLMEALRPRLESRFQQLAFTKNANPELMAIELQANHANPMVVIKQEVNGMQQMPRMNLSMMNTRALVLIGAADQLVAPDAQQEFYGKLKNGVVKVIPHASHMMLLEKPKIVNESITSFFRR